MNYIYLCTQIIFAKIRFSWYASFCGSSAENSGTRHNFVRNYNDGVIVASIGHNPREKSSLRVGCICSVHRDSFINRDVIQTKHPLTGLD